MFSPFAILISKAGLPVQSWKRYKLELPNFVNMNQTTKHTWLQVHNGPVQISVSSISAHLDGRQQRRHRSHHHRHHPWSRCQKVNIFPTSHKYTHPRNKNEGGVSFLAIEIFAENVPKFGRQILQKICKSWGHTKVQFLCEMTEFWMYARILPTSSQPHFV